MEIILTAADHEKNGFVALAEWRGMTEIEARGLIAKIDDLVDPEAEPDTETEPFTFILDLMDGPNTCLDTGVRSLPLQVVMRLAPEQVSRWLDERPEPDDVAFERVPVLPAMALAAS